MADVGEVRVRVLYDANQVTSGVARTKSELKGLSWKGILEGDKAAQALSSSLRGVGTALTVGVTAPLAAVGGLSTSAAVKFESSFAGVRKTVDATEEQFQALSQAARDMAKSKPVNVNDVNLIMELGGQLGVAQENLVKFADVVSDLDVSTDLGVEQASTQLAQFMNITGQSYDNVDRLGATLVALGNNSATTESAIMNMGMRIAGAGHQIGLTDDQILAVAASLSSVGIEAEAGGTAISTIMSNIDKEVATNGKHLEDWARVAGMSSEEFKAAWSSDALGTLTTVFRQMGDSGDNLNVVLDDLGITSLRQSDTMKRMSGAADLMAASVQTASQAWEENTALTNEASRRYETTESKIEVFKNKLNDVGISLGGSFADALTGVLDAAEPLIDMLSRGAEAFAGMSKEQQQAVIQMALVAAAIGPITNGAGRLVGSIGNITSAFKTMTEGVKIANVAMGALEGVLGVAIVVALGTLYDKFKEWKTHCDNMTASTSGAREALSLFGKSIQDQGDSASGASTSLDGMRGKIDEVVNSARSAAEDGAKFTQSMKDSFTEVGQNAGVVQQYADKISELAGNCGGSAEKVAELKGAVEQYNKLTGDNIKVIDEQSGKISESTGKVKENTDAWVANAWAQAGQEKLTEAMKLRMDLAEKLNKEKEAYAKWQKSQRPGVGREQKQNAQHDSQDQAFKDSIAGLEKQLDSADESIATLTEHTTEYMQKADEAAKRSKSFAEALNKAEDSGEAFSSLAERLGVSADDLSSALDASGISAEEFASLGSENFARLYQEAQGDMSKIRDAVDLTNELHINPKHLHVTDDGTIADEAGRVWDLDAQTIDGKHFTVNDDGTISIENTNVDHLDANTIADKDFVITDNGTAATAEGNADSVNSAVRSIPYDKTVTISVATEAAMSALSGLSSRIASIASQAIHLNTTGYASGGMFGYPLKVYKHADGGLNGIAVRPVMTNAGLVGEDGAEAVLGNKVVPLTNRRYTRPFAQTLAQEMTGTLSTDIAQKVAKRLVDSPALRTVDWSAPPAMATSSVLWPNGQQEKTEPVEVNVDARDPEATALLRAILEAIPDEYVMKVDRTEFARLCRKAVND
ncbi:phage tail tape measure protein, TP901 family [Cryptobacterium curtum DSM 15641]|uniref:Phage tail tape measure protein, TP901 family n=1 Tax=Cryptobacterium curtum (strain ATCC 700683 / DSM 15641 / CCUG 43107 / 12-3) TaxID=469378 RepID=C7MM53_CRYCD|nr:phage tail tape measure protein [Cryptobacterium curtum]ACU93993.1 phage tail tape measure protein, TP901 family [Cryptobacterium curtum DSM 15641]